MVSLMLQLQQQQQQQQQEQQQQQQYAEVIDGSEDWLRLMKAVFDFGSLRKLIESGRGKKGKSGNSAGNRALNGEIAADSDAEFHGDSENAPNFQFKFLFDAMNGAGGPTAYRLFVEELGADPKALRRCKALPDFGGIHPDPNLVYAGELVRIMGVNTPEKVTEETPHFAAAADGDCDRNMILGTVLFILF
ncbi:phosphoglucomutase/parafusin related protein 1, putative [Eimeria brunetti]|uniref:Phosphoglucomutase/parafusin related protein 1, putative n=1 Tax=Eimeria brunetti TaxID=51314 RepID=U6LFN6_9EIME|nr:phosphoglucomutase/parafusin related protein 1, putative [Eimeria brunetti]